MQNNVAVSVEEVWNTFNTRLERFIRKRVSDEQAADDILQDVYVKVHTHIDSLRDDTRLQAWVYQIARNAVHDHYRSQKPHAEMSDFIAVDGITDASDDITQRLSESVRCMIESLPEDYRQALLLTEYEGLTQQALADRLGISLSGAKSRVQRGRKMLREMLLACCHFQFDRLGKVIDYHPRCHCCSETGCVH